MENKKLNFFLIFSFCFWHCAFAQEMPSVTKTEEVKGFTMTIVDKGGKEKAAISGSVANMLPGGLVEILEVVARVYGRDMEGTDTLIHTSKGIYDRLKNIITTDQFVRINRRDVVITGTGLEWIPDKSRLEIEENVKVEYSSSNVTTNGAGNASTQKRTIIITSRGSGLLDYQGDVAVFKKNVVAEDPDATLKAHRMKMFFSDKTQGLIKVEAYGNVRIKQPHRESSSRRAVYYVGEDKIVLTGNPRIVQGLDFYTANKVTIYDKGQRVVFEPRAKLIIYASTEHDI